MLRGYRRLVQHRPRGSARTRTTSRRSFFDAVVENARKIIDAVKPKRARFCYEMMGWALPDSPDSYLKLIKAVDRPAFGVHLDPCNLVNSPEKFYHNTALLNECFDKLGPLDRELPRQGPDLGRGDERPFPRSGARQRLAGLHDLPETPGRAAAEPAPDDRASGHTGGIRRGREYIFEVGRKAGLTFS